MIADTPPRKRTIAALLAAAATAGLSVGAIDRARGVQPSASRIFNRLPALPVPAGNPAAAPASSPARGGDLSGETK